MTSSPLVDSAQMAARLWRIAAALIVAALVLRIQAATLAATATATPTAAAAAARPVSPSIPQPVPQTTPLSIPQSIPPAVSLSVPPSASQPVPPVPYQRLEEMHHTAWTARDGLTGNPQALAQTLDGYLWIGTLNGLFRFDGVTFERYQPEDGPLPAASVTALLATRDGGLWVGHAAGATFIHADRRSTHYTTADGLPHGVRQFAQDHAGVIWVTATGGLARLDAGRWQSVRQDWNYPCRSAWRVLAASDGTLWVAAASPNKLLYLPPGARAFVDAGFDEPVSALVQTGERTIWVMGMDSGMLHEVRRDDRAASTRLLRHLPAQQMAIDRDGAVWLPGYGLSRLRPECQSAQPPADRCSSSLEHLDLANGLSGGIAMAVLVDREQNVWVTTESGLDRFRHRNISWKAEPQLRDTASLAADANGDVWVLPWEPPSMMRALDGKPVAGAPTHISVAFPDREGGLWISTHKNFLHWSGGRFLPVAPPAEVTAKGYNFRVMAAAEDRGGRLWAAILGMGLFYREQERWTFVPVLADRPDLTATRVHVDDANRVWLAYSRELAMLDGTAVRAFTKTDGLDVGGLLSMASRQGTVWVGGDSGLAVLQNGRFHAVRSAAGDDVDAIAEIVPTRDGLWLSAGVSIVFIPDAELQRVVADPRHRVKTERFDLVSDLPEPLASAWRGILAVADRDGGVVFLTNAGIARVDPRRVVRNTVPPPVAIRAVTADDVAYAARGDVRLPPLTRTLRIDYTALSLRLPERVRFRYRLEGWETDWHDAGTRRTVFYTDLKPGRYAFRVLACNNDGVWNDTGATLALVVAPAWYQTAWFQGLVAAGLIVALLTLYRVRLRRVSAALSARFDERLAERTRIARDLHDTLLQTVQASKLVADDVLDRIGQADPQRPAMERLSDWLGRAVHEGRAALHSLRAPTVDANDLADAFERFAQEPIRPAAMTVSVIVRGEARALHPIVREEIHQIGCEAMRNACAHARATRLAIEIGYGHDLTLRITDDGVGIDPAIAASGKNGRFGLPGMRERAAAIEGTLSVQSAAPGTQITLTVPGRLAFRRGASASTSGKSGRQ